METISTYIMYMQIVTWCLFGTKCPCKSSTHVKTVKEDKIMLPAIKNSNGNTDKLFSYIPKNIIYFS